MNVGLREYRNTQRVLCALFAFAALGTGWPATGEWAAAFSADAGTITPPFVLTNGYVFQPIETSATNGGRAVYSFTLAQPGQYAIQAEVEARQAGANALLVNIDSEPTAPEMVWTIPVTNGFASRVVGTSAGSPRSFSLTAGKHQIIIRGKEPHVRFSHLYVIGPPAAPTNLRIVAGP